MVEGILLGIDFQYQDFIKNGHYNNGFPKLAFWNPCFNSWNSMERQYQHPKKNEQLNLPSIFYLYAKAASEALRNGISTSAGHAHWLQA